ncbi:CLUMA_CG018836, isoform A [Clunio marinus]|uniref:CLUMA_CG018836, isoform A n=1 Tax=Clunio marinus TaxID=568069 RepID=A0A1J1J084_9DIPT|nr:CLUMA_CG018836, isoform A [Clunio marinus]
MGIARLKNVNLNIQNETEAKISIKETLNLISSLFLVNGLGNAFNVLSGMELQSSSNIPTLKAHS